MDLDQKLTITYFAADYPLKLGLAQRVFSAGDAVAELLGIKNISSGPTGVVLRDPGRRLVVQLNPVRTFVQTLGSPLWNTHRKDLIKAVALAMENLGVNAVKRFGFKILSFVRLSMTHAELVDLLFSSHMADRFEMQGDYGEINDVILQFYGKYQTTRYTLRIVPQKSSEARQTFLGEPNLEAMTENKFLDTSIRDFHQLLSDDCLLFECDCYLEDARSDQLEAFLVSAQKALDAIFASVIRRIKGYPKGVA